MEQRKSVIWAGYSAIILVSLMIVAKMAAYYETGSASILSSLMDSILDSLISLTALASIHYANQPPDKNHRWGHGKMEAVSALFQAAIIAAGGAFVIFESTNRLFIPVQIEGHTFGFLVMLFSTVISIILITIQRYALNKSESLALEADHAHYGSDIIVNIGVMFILITGAYGAPIWLDPIFAIGVSIYLAFIAKNIGIKAVNMLMDHELPDESRSKIIKLIEDHSKVLGWHDLRTHLHGTSVIISFDIEVDGQMILLDAHEIAKELELKIIEIFPSAEIMIHIDPEGQPQDARHRIKGIHH